MYNNQHYSQTELKRKDKYKQRKHKNLLVLIILFFLLLAIIIYFNSPISRIRDIEINGLNLLTEDEIYDKAELNDNMKYLLTKSSSIEAKLLQLKEAKNVTVTKSFPGKLKINIIEYKPIALLETEKGWNPILENGYIYEKDYNAKLINYPLITKWNSDIAITILAEELSQVNPSVLNEISEIQQNTVDGKIDQLILYSRDGYKIHIGLEDIGKKLNLYPTIVESLRSKDINGGNIYFSESIRFEEFKLEELDEKAD